MFRRSLQKQFQGSGSFYVVKEHQDNLLQKLFHDFIYPLK